MIPKATGAVTDLGTRLFASRHPKYGPSRRTLKAEKAIPKATTSNKALQLETINFLRCQIGTAIATTAGPSSQTSGADFSR